MPYFDVKAGLEPIEYKADLNENTFRHSLMTMPPSSLTRGNFFRSPSEGGTSG